MNRKISHLSYSKVCTKDYLKQLPLSLARVVFRAKTGMLDIKTNYKNKYFCCVLDESSDHIFTCRFGIRVSKEIKRNFNSCSSKTLKKRQKSRHINNFTLTNKKFNKQLPIV